MKVVHAKNYKSELENSTDQLNAVLVLSDQAPGDSKKSYWMNFLNQETPILFGTEIMANAMNYSVVNFITRKTRRGYYEITLAVITEDPKTMDWGTITEKHTHLLEQEIKQIPYFWLWSHKRWKREIPNDLEKLKEEQRERFNTKFRA
jgi:KDO2-lipid IV(A) lauroyltransferase